MGDGLAQRGLTHTRRSYETQNRGFHVLPQLQHGQMLYDSVFHLVKPEMVGIKNALGAFQVKVVLGELTPRQINQILQIVQLNTVFRRLRMGAFQFLQFPVENFGHFLRPLFLLGLFLQLLDILFVGIAAQLLLNGPQLLVEVILALLFVHVVAHLALDLLLQFKHLLRLGQHGKESVGYLVEVACLQNPLTHRKFSLDVAGHEIQQKHGVFDALDGKARLLRQVARAGDDLYGQVPDRLQQSLELARVGYVFRSRVRYHGGLHVGFVLDGFHHLEAADALYDDRDAAVGHLESLEDLRRSAYLVEVVKHRLVHIRFLLRDDTDGLALAAVFLHQLDGFLAPHGDGNDRARIKHRVAQRHDGQFLRHRLILAELALLDGQHGNELGIRVNHI